MRSNPIIAVVIMAVLVGCSGSGGPKKQETNKAPNTVSNQLPDPPKGRSDMHDPSTLGEVDGYLVTFCTSTREERGIRTRYLPPETDIWEVGDVIFSGDERPTWIAERLPRNTGSFWAPDLPFPDEWILYYSAYGHIDETDEACIGRATATGTFPNLSWTDDGQPVICANPLEDGGPMAIDPSVFRGPEGTLWMAFGSHWTGIWIVELDPVTGNLTPEADGTWSRDNPNFHQVAKGPPTEEFPDGGAIEAAFVYRYGDYYYLFVNWGICCNGINSTYNIRVGRSASPTGPYLDKDGADMVNRGGALILEREGRYIGPGHAGIFQYHKNGEPRYAFTFHFYDGENDGRPTLGIRELVWEDGWPVVTNVAFSRF